MNNNKILKNFIKIVCCLAMVISHFSSSIVFVKGEELVPSVTITLGGPRILSKVENIDSPAFSWMIADTQDGEFSSIGSDSYYDITSANEGKYVKLVVNGIESNVVGPIGKLIEFDVGNGSITLDANYSGKDADNNTVSGEHKNSNIYVIKQANNTNYSTNKISVLGGSSETKYDVTIDGIHLGSAAEMGYVPNSSYVASYGKGVIDLLVGSTTSEKTKHAVLRIKGENIVRAIHYSTDYNTSSSLKITDINGDGETSGHLYIPVKKVTAEEINEFVNSKLSYNHWNSGIGGDDGSFDDVKNLELAGGNIQVLTTYSDNCTAIGAGGNGPADILISGGKIVAHANGTGTAIGGGIGWFSAGGTSNITITGGDVYAENHGEIYVKGSTIVSAGSNYDELVGGVAIGSGSSFQDGGATATINISGGTVKAYGAYGNGIGGGNSSSSTGGTATINITGGTVEATSIGGGSSQKGVGGNATVNVSGNPIVKLSDGIGGGNSANGTGGAATITVNGGTMDCAGVIGGGTGGNTGDGGKATVVVKDGMLTAKSIGGGLGSIGGNGGAADINISGGKIVTGSIGGGDTQNPSGNLGYAVAKISGGDISGQFLMAAAGSTPCSFTMTGGVLHGVDTTTSTGIYEYSKSNGAAVYMDDPKGIATLSGGTIEDCKAVNGGAVYMTAGTFTISGTGVIQDCDATDTGGAVYLGGGTLDVKGGRIQYNSATNGGGVYVNNGTMNATGGYIQNNTASVLGGGALINGGTVNMRGGNVLNNTATDSGGGIAVVNGNYNMAGGSVDNNTATNNTGGGVYVSSTGANVDVNIYSGSISGNTASKSGGALSVIGDKDGSQSIQVQIGVNKQHFEKNGDTLDPIECDHDYIDSDSYKALSCPQINNNVTGLNGGAVYVTGNTSTELKMYCLEETGNKVNHLEDNLSYFMKVEGGNILMSTILPEPDGELLDSAQENSIYGNIDVENTIHATGGTVHIYGKMTNPETTGIVTIDMLKDTDKFVDHRISDKYYKLHYYENFTDPETGITTGQYKAFSIDIGDTHNILGNIYEHPGYTIVGWNTSADGSHSGNAILDDPNKVEGWYKVGEGYKFDGNPLKDLIIYAIWKANGYKVYFDSNIPENTQFEGSMPEYQMLNIDKKDNLHLNGWIYPGYNFIEWNTKKDGSGTSYADGQEVLNLTTEDSITLYAQWEKCDHLNIHNYEYTVINDGKTIQAECSCKGYRETITLNAKDYTYDRNEHPATFVKAKSDENVTISLFDDIEISYTYRKLDASELQPIDVQPKNAGVYVASISAGGKTASVTFTISKSAQPAPGKPEFEILNDKTITVLSVENSSYISDPTYDSVKEYRLVYYNGNQRVEIPWKTNDTKPTDNNGYTFELPVALTTYYVYARYSEGTNYLASSEKPADIPYDFGGATVIVSCGEGIEFDLNLAGANINENGAILQIHLIDEDVYYYPKDFTITHLTTIDGVEFNSTQMQIDSLDKEKFTFSGIPVGSVVTITIPDAKKHTNIKGNVTEKEVFGRVTTDTATISRDSAYTASFEVNNYDVTEYEVLSLSFSNNLPENTAIIMKDQVTNSYYWTKLDSPTNSILLTEFVKMGTQDTKYELTNGDKKVLFAIDFSECTDGIEGDALVTSMIAENQIGSNAKDANKQVNTKLEDKATFELTTSLTGLTKNIGYKVSDSEGIASIWDNRNMSILLKPNSSVPSDAYIIFKYGNTTIVSYANELGYYVAPLGEFGDGNLQATLVSKLFPSNSTSYEFNVELKVSDSLASVSPCNVVESVANTTITFNTSATSIPSIKIEADKSIYNVSENNEAGRNIMLANVKFLNMVSTYDVELILMRKAESGNYVNTGWSQQINLSNDREQTAQVRVVLDGQRAGSFMVLVNVASGVDTVAKANYYFIITENKDENGTFQ